jgi:dTDP-glucose 4,6-dehydratase
MKILVTGGAGFIGSNFIRFLLGSGKGYRLVNLDKLTYAGNLENLSDLAKSPAYEFVRGDICDGKLVDCLLGDGGEGVVNFAAESHATQPLQPDVFIQTSRNVRFSSTPPCATK